MDSDFSIETATSPRETTTPSELKKKLYKAVMGQQWLEVATLYTEHPEIHAAKITNSGDTALHVALSNGAPAWYVQSLMHKIENTGAIAVETLATENNRKDTPLHCAASRGFLNICDRIVRLDMSLIYKRNVDGETPLFLAAINDHKQTFLYLHDVCRRMPTRSTSESDLWRRRNGDTILHCTIERQYFDLSFQIIHLYEEKIVRSVNEVGYTPLSALASNPSAFRGGTRLKWWQRLYYKYIQVEKLKFDNSGTHQTSKADAPAKSHHTRGSIKNMKEKHVWVNQIVEALVYQSSEYEFDEIESTEDLSEAKQLEKDISEKEKEKGEEMKKNSGKEQSQGKSKKDKKSTSLLIATKLGLIELVERILAVFPVAIYDQTATKQRNIVLQAVHKRQPHILEELTKHPLWLTIREVEDADGNNALHLAANLPEHMPWEIHGSAMQMQWEVKWFEYVKEIMPPYLIFQDNNQGQTPEEIFAQKHRKLIKEANTWLKDTTGSYSIVAALTAGVTYATSYTVPGGTDDSGKPVLQGQPAFNLFAIAVLVSFCFSITSLAAFLAVYSSRMQAKDFRRSLPLRLCLGLTSFFVSVVAMLVSFCAAHSFELDRREKRKISPWYSLSLIPLVLYAAAQIPLYWDLFRASFTKVPKAKYVGEDIPAEHVPSNSCFWLSFTDRTSSLML